MDGEVKHEMFEAYEVKDEDVIQEGTKQEIKEEVVYYKENPSGSSPNHEWKGEEENVVKEEVFEAYDEFDTEDDTHPEQEHKSKHLKTATTGKECAVPPTVTTVTPLPFTRDTLLHCTIVKFNKCKFVCTKACTLQLHQLVHASDKPYTCPDCAYQTSAAWQFNQHICIHNDDKSFYCPHCSDYFFMSLRDLNLHVKCHHSSTVMKCELCAFTAFLPTTMTRHILNHHSEEKEDIIKETLTCDRCEFIATKSDSMKEHELVHSALKPWHCPLTECSFSSSATSNYNQHILQHYNDKPYSCPHCDRYCSSVVATDKHIKTNHRDTEITCDTCDYTAFLATAMVRHTKKYHSSGSGSAPTAKVLHCDKCKFIATKTRSLELHAHVHNTGPPPHSCPLCDYVAASTSQYNYHVLMHGKDKPYQCNYCSSCFNRPSHINKHIRCLHPNSVIKCKQCDFIAVQPRVMSNHYEKCHSLNPSSGSDLSPGKVTRKQECVSGEDEVVPKRACVQGTVSRACVQRDTDQSLANQSTVYRSRDLSLANQSTVSRACVRRGIEDSNALGETQKKTATDHSDDSDHSEITQIIKLKCEHCDFIATKPSSLKLHRVVHNGKKPYKCEHKKCAYSTTDRSHFNYHIRGHGDDKPFSCPHCEFRAVYASDLNQHGNTVHPDCVITCNLCDYTAVLHTDMSTHNDTCHSGVTGIKKCLQCEFIATKEQSINHHLIVHDTEKPPFQCLLCIYKTADVDKFNYHILVHYRDEPYACPHCANHYRNQSYLHAHIKAKHPNDIIKCNQCDFIAFLPTNMDKHKKQKHDYSTS